MGNACLSSEGIRKHVSVRTTLKNKAKDKSTIVVSDYVNKMSLDPPSTKPRKRNGPSRKDNYDSLYKELDLVDDINNKKNPRNLWALSQLHKSSIKAI